MPVRVPAPPKPAPRKTVKLLLNLSPLGRGLVIGIASIAVISLIVFLFFYNKYSKLTDEKLNAGPFPNSSLLYAAPESIGIGDPGTPLDIAGHLRESGYGEDARTNRVGWYHLRPEAIEIFPGADSYARGEAGVLFFRDGKVANIIALNDNTQRTEYVLEPALLSNLFDKNREKRRLVRFNDIPPVLVHAVISIEDKRFFQHSGFDPFRIVVAVVDDVRKMRKFSGASTLTQQLARMLWLDSRKTYSRKLAELMITLHLERKLTKQKIFEYYANQVPLGQRGSFAIRGFGEASQAYFGKDIRQLTLDEAATLAGLIQQPSFRNPVRWPERARARRNVVLAQMLNNGYITKAQYDQSSAAPITVTKQGIESADAPYFVDLVNERLGDDFQDRDFQGTGYRVYTTLDLDLQRDAAEAVAEGIRELDATMAKRRGGPTGDPQVALICLDPHTGQIKALIGGKNYGISQLNHVEAKRPSGSIFKPFVYAAALNSGINGNQTVITPSTTFQDEPRTFEFAGQEPYEPGNFNEGWRGTVTFTQALAKSMNVPAVEVAEATGYKVVADLAHRAGLPDIRATPAMALGAYDVTPMEMAGAYTIFANKGMRVQPRLIDLVLDKEGQTVWESKPETKRVLDPRIAFIMVTELQEVMRTGTAAGVRARGFGLPAAGKTGTSHDAWFAGFTTKLLCVVWVGLDDYKDLKLEGAKAALPIWTDFMKRAHKHRGYRGVGEFDAPDGLVSSQVDLDTGELATASCPQVRTQYYLTGTQPTQFCHLHGGGSTQIAGWGDTPAPPANTMNPVPTAPTRSAADNLAPPDPAQQAKDKEKKKGLLDRLKGIFK